MQKENEFLKTISILNKNLREREPLESTFVSKKLISWGILKKELFALKNQTFATELMNIFLSNSTYLFTPKGKLDKFPSIKKSINIINFSLRKRKANLFYNQRKNYYSRNIKRKKSVSHKKRWKLSRWRFNFSRTIC